MKKKHVILNLVHSLSESTLREYNQTSKQTEDIADCFLLIHGNKVKDLKPLTGERNHVFWDEEIRSVADTPYFQNHDIHVFPGNEMLSIIEFYRKYKYDYYWVIEGDVRFTGSWSTFFGSFKDDNADFLTSHIRRYRDEPNWYLWNDLYHQHLTVDLQEKIRSFNPVFRISRKALEHIEKQYFNGWGGHYELMVPTLLHQGGYKIKDFGGTGEFVSRGDKNKFYTDCSSVELNDGTMRYAHPHLFLFNKPSEKLIHPFKHDRWLRLVKVSIIKLLILLKLKEPKPPLYCNP